MSDPADIERSKRFAANLKRFRAELGLTQQELADRAGIAVFSGSSGLTAVPS